MGAPPSRIAEIVWFIDRCFGRHMVADALRAAGADVRIHDDEFAQDASDEEWLPEIGARGWVLLTRDERIQRRPAEKQALQSANVGAFFVSAGGLTGPQIGEMLVRILPKMTRHAQRLTRPFIATISPSGDIKVKLGERRGGIKRK